MYQSVMVTKMIKRERNQQSEMVLPIVFLSFPLPQAIGLLLHT